jgi:anti-sigma B factor antagonist
MELTLDVHKHPEATVVVAEGEIDLATTGDVRDTIGELIVDGDVHLVVDLQKVSFLDSTGLGAFIGARRRAHAFKGSFSLVCTNESRMKIFRITRLDRVLDFYETQEAALAAAAEHREAALAATGD